MNRILLRVAPAVLLALLAGCGDKAQQPTASAGSSRAADDGAADVEKGLEALKQQDPAAAAAAFTTAAVKCETNFEARVNLAMVRKQLGNLDEAATAAAEALALCPESAEARLVDGQLAYAKKEYKRALEDFQAVLNEKSLPAPIRSEAWSARGVVELAQENFDSARLSLLRAMRLDRRNPAAWYHLGVLYRDIYKFNDSAIEHFQMAAGLLKANDPRARKISREILPALRKAINASASPVKVDLSKRDPKAAEKMLAEAKAMRARKEITNATKKIEAAYAADPLSDAVALEYARIKALRIRNEVADVDNILVAYRTAIDQNPTKQDVYYEAAQLAYKYKRWSTTVQILDRAAAHDPSYRKNLDLLIAALQKAGKDKQADAWKAFRAEVR